MKCNCKIQIRHLKRANGLGRVHPGRASPERGGGTGESKGQEFLGAGSAGVRQRSFKVEPACVARLEVVPSKRSHTMLQRRVTK